MGKISGHPALTASKNNCKKWICTPPSDKITENIGTFLDVSEKLLACGNTTMLWRVSSIVTFGLFLPQMG